jgi:hypothetical protein
MDLAKFENVIQPLNENYSFDMEIANEIGGQNGGHWEVNNEINSDIVATKSWGKISPLSRAIVLMLTSSLRCSFSGR